MHEIPKRSDVIIIGGGLVGCSMAYYLSCAGAEVTLFEKRNISSGASGRCGGMVVQADGREAKTIESERFLYTRENNKILEGLEEELHYGFEYRQIGSLDIACTEIEWEQLKNITALQKTLGDDEVKLLDNKETRQLCPILGPIVRGSRYRASDGSLNANKLTFAYARAAQKLGAKLQPYTPVDKILIEDNVVRGVSHNYGVSYSRWVVNATNAWASYLTPQIEIVPCKGSAIVTEPVTHFPALVWEAYPDGTMIWGAQHSGGNILFGSAPEIGLNKMKDHYEETVYFEDIEKAIRRFNTLFPDLSEASVIRTWAGTVAFTADALPCLGEIPGIENLIINAGFPVGMSWCPIMGKLGAEVILNRGETSLPIKMFAPSRFNNRTVSWPDNYNYTILQDFINQL
jgi:sarcosine oxidase, subunit beta